jgi:5'-3' exonuclease
MIDNKQSDIFSIWENLKSEKKLAHEKGLNSIIKKEVLIVDGTNTFLRCFAAIPTLNDNGLHTGGISGFLKSVGYAIKQFQPDRCVIVFDGVGGSMKRRKIYSEYKEHRKTKVRLNRIYEDTSLGDEDISLKKQFQRLVIYLQSLPVNVIALDNVEADDTIAYLALDSFKDWNAIIMSSDKDFLQIVNDHVRVWSPTKKRIYGPQDVLNEYGINSQNFVYFRALCGDDSDNIPGVRGCGLKTVVKAFPMLAGDRVELTVLKDYAIEYSGKLKVYDTIVKDWQDVERNYELMQLTNTALTTMAQLHVKEVLDNPIAKLNRFELIKQMSSDNLTNNIYNLPNWINECFSKLNSFVRD